MSSPGFEAAPSARTLLRSTIVAVAVASFLLVTCVLPAEYGYDLTGIGRVLGLTQMGEVKMALAEEAASNAAAEASADSVIAASESGVEATGSEAAGSNPAQTARVDTTLVTLPSGKGGEIKLVMAGGTRAGYRWTVSNGVVNFDMHGDSTNAPKDWFVSYRKGQSAGADSGELAAPFNGNHGWYWRNRGAREVLITLITTGTYARIEKHL